MASHKFIRILYENFLKKIMGKKQKKDLGKKRKILPFSQGLIINRTNYNLLIAKTCSAMAK